MNLEFQTLKFWNAAHFVRRSRKPDLSLATQILEYVATNAPERLSNRAIDVLVEIDNEQLKRTSNG